MSNDPQEWLDPNNRVYREDQVITEDDLRNFIELLLVEYNLAIGAEKTRIGMSIKTADALLDWIVTGKQDDFRGML